MVFPQDERVSRGQLRATITFIIPPVTFRTRNPAVATRSGVGLPEGFNALRLAAAHRSMFTIAHMRALSVHY
jgi:hypothetical protein